MSDKNPLITKWVSRTESEPNHQDKVGHSILTVQFSKGHGPEPELKCNSGPKGKRVCGWGPGMRLRRMILVQSGALSFPPVEIYSSCIRASLLSLFNR